MNGFSLKTKKLIAHEEKEKCGHFSEVDNIFYKKFNGDLICVVPQFTIFNYRNARNYFVHFSQIVSFLSHFIMTLEQRERTYFQVIDHAENKMAYTLHAT